MKRQINYVLLLLAGLIPAFASAFNCDDCSCRATSKTFYTIEPVFQNSSPERLTFFRENRMMLREDGWKGALQIVPFGGKSTKGDRLARYFMPYCLDEILVSEAQGVEGTTVLANQLNIYTANGDFQSRVSFDPRHTFAGVGLNYVQKFYETCAGNAWWFGISLPIEHVKNSMNLCETVINDGGGAITTTPDFPVVGNVTEAFQQPSWQYGRIGGGTITPAEQTTGCCNTSSSVTNNCGKMSKTGVADLELLLGSDWLMTECASLSSWFGLLVPTGTRVKGVQVFEPVIGHNHHWGILLGANAGFDVWHHPCKERSIRYELDMNWWFMFSRDEVRSFDLINKPWSRYMQVYLSQADATAAAAAVAPYNVIQATPGINLFTQQVKVKPGFQRTINSALVYTACRLEAEVGYNLFVRESECVKLKCVFPEGAALKSLLGAGQTDGVQIIGDNYLNVNADALINYSQNIITAADLDLESASSPSQFLSTFYGALGYRMDEREYPMIFGLGGSYQWSRDNNGMNRWMIWGKAAVSF